MSRTRKPKPRPLPANVRKAINAAIRDLTGKGKR